MLVLVEVESLERNCVEDLVAPWGTRLERFSLTRREGIPDFLRCRNYQVVALLVAGCWVQLLLGEVI